MRKWLFRCMVAAAITLAALGVSVAKAADVPLEDDVLAYLYAECEYREVDPALILAMIETESGFDASVISSTNDYGLMQINRVNHAGYRDHFGEEWNPLDPMDNLRAGIYCIAGYLAKYDTHKALMAFNMGHAGAKRLWVDGIYTTGYSRKIIKGVEKYADINTGNAADGMATPAAIRAAGAGDVDPDAAPAGQALR